MFAAAREGGRGLSVVSSTNTNGRGGSGHGCGRGYGAGRKDSSSKKRKKSKHKKNDGDGDASSKSSVIHETFMVKWKLQPLRNEGDVGGLNGPCYS